METNEAKSHIEAAYDKAYQAAIREGATSVSDLEISINEKMIAMGFVKHDAQEPTNIPD